MTQSLGILSWGSHDTLRQSLESYKQWGLTDYFDDRNIFFQQISSEDIKIAKKYGYGYDGAVSNIGIAGGYRHLVENALGDTFLFLENDWKLIEAPSGAIFDGRWLLNVYEANLIRYRHRVFPGNPLWTRQFEGKEYERPTHLLDSVHWTDPSRFEEVAYRQIEGRDWYITSARHANWTNNPHMAYTSFLKTQVLPHIGDSVIENTLQGWWEQQEFLVAQGQGLFEHNRID